MSVHHIRLLAGTGLAAAALALAACGGEDNQEFIDAAKTASTEVSAIGTDLGPAVAGAAQKTNAELQTQFTTFADRVGKSVKDLKALDPPNEDVTSTVDALSTALTKAEKDLNDIAKAAGAGDAAAAEKASATLVTDSPPITESNTKLKKQVAELEKDE